MDSEKEQIESLLSAIELKRKRSAKYTWIGLLLPIILGIALITVSVIQVRTRLKQIEYLDEQIAKKQSEALEKEAQIAELDRRLQGYSQLVNENPTILKSAITAIESNSTIAEAIPRIYLIVPDDQHVRTAQIIKSQLQKDGYIVPQIKRRTKLRPNTEIRYFLEGDRQMAETIFASLRKIKINDAETKFIPLESAKPGEIEIWLSPIGEKVSEIIAEQLDVEPSKVTPYARLEQDLGAEPSDLTEIVTRLKEQFAIEIPDSDISSLKKVIDVYNIVLRQINKKENPN